MQTHGGEATQTASNQTPVSSRRQSAPDCYKRHDLFCPETILRLNIIQTKRNIACNRCKATKGNIIVSQGEKMTLASLQLKKTSDKLN